MLHLFCTSNANNDTMNKHEQRSSVTDRLSACSSRSAVCIVPAGSFTFLQSESKNQICQRLPVADPGFFRRGGRQTIILTSFPQKCVKIKKNWTKKGCIAGAPLWIRQCLHTYQLWSTTVQEAFDHERKKTAQKNSN